MTILLQPFATSRNIQENQRKPSRKLKSSSSYVGHNSAEHIYCLNHVSASALSNQVHIAIILTPIAIVFCSHYIFSILFVSSPIVSNSLICQLSIVIILSPAPRCLRFIIIFARLHFISSSTLSTFYFPAPRCFRFIFSTSQSLSFTFQLLICFI